MDATDDRIQELRKEALAYQGSGKGTRYPEDFKSRVLEMVEELRGRGFSQESTAGRLGLHSWRVSCWRQARAEPIVGEARLVPVEVVPVPRVPRSLAVSGPCGLQLQGLDLDTLAELLRRLA